MNEPSTTRATGGPCSSPHLGVVDPARAAARTLDLLDELGVLWGPRGRISLSIHRLPHEVVHALGGRPLAYRDPIGGDLLTTRLGSPLGLEVVWFADADRGCAACRDLLDGYDAAEEIVAAIEGEVLDATGR